MELQASFGPIMGLFFVPKKFPIALPPSLVLGQQHAAVHAGEDRLEVDGALLLL